MPMPLFFFLSMRSIRHIALLVLFLSLAWVSKADSRRLFNHSFIGLSGGLSSYATDNYSLFQNLGYNGTLTLGKWMLSPSGARLQFGYQSVAGNDGVLRGYTTATFSFMCDPIRAFSHSDKRKPVTTYIFAGAGAVHRQGDNDLLFDFGCNASLRISDAMDLFAEVGSHFFPGGFDGNTRTSFMFNASLGLSYMFKDNPLSRRPSGESLNFVEDWYLGVGIGANSMVALRNLSAVTPAPSFDILFGKHFSTIWEARMRVSGLQSALDRQYFGFMGLNADLMCNVINVVGYKHNRPWNPTLYAGAGIIDNLSDENGFLFTLNGGFYLRHWVGPRSDVYLDVRGMAVPSRFSVAGTPYMATISIGYISSLGKGTCR